MKVFCCEHLIEREGRGKYCSVANIYINDTLPELINNEKIYGDPIRGVVYFEGFDFGGYSAETLGLEPLLEETYVLLKEFYAAENQPDKKPVDFVFLGHSQGGLRSLAMTTYLKNKDPILYKQLKGVITFSGIDKGLKLLTNQGANFRTTARNDVKILVNGVYGTIKVLDFIPNGIITDFIINQLIKNSLTDATYSFMNKVLCEWLGLTKGFAYPIMNNTNWNQYAQIRDMCPQSEFIQEYVLEEKPYYYKVASGTKTVIKWKKGWFGIYYPTLVKETVYTTIQTTDVNMKIDKDLPLKFVIGTHNNSLSMASEKLQQDINEGMTIAGNVFRGAQIAHIAKSILILGLFTNSPVYASDCKKAADWCYNYNDEISELIGESSHDGLVAVSSQQLPTYTKEGASTQTKVLNKSNRVLYCRNHANITETGSVSRNKINDYADELLGIKNRNNKVR